MVVYSEKHSCFQIQHCRKAGRCCVGQLLVPALKALNVSSVTKTSDQVWLVHFLDYLFASEGRFHVKPVWWCSFKFLSTGGTKLPLTWRSAAGFRLRTSHKTTGNYPKCRVFTQIFTGSFHSNPENNLWSHVVKVLVIISLRLCVSFKVCLLSGSKGLIHADGNTDKLTGFMCMTLCVHQSHHDS